MSHYAAIEKVIGHIMEQKLHTLSLEELAVSLEMSPGHLQKLFTKWVGISPKQFGRYLSLQHAKGLLAASETTLTAATKAGLSGTGRLHDLFVDIEAMTPGEYKDGGAGLTLRYSTFDTVFGRCLVASTEKGICAVLFHDETAAGMADLASRFPNARLVPKAEPSHRLIREYFSGLAPTSKIKLHLYGTNFQIKVWEALLSIPEGRISTYGRIATKLGTPGLSRAVGSAIGDNPVGYIIPCHRVLKATGEISGYRWGVERKRAMLAYEALRTETSQ